jgi:hypothetical protein
MFDEYHDEINNIVNVLLDSFIFVKEGRKGIIGILEGFCSWICEERRVCFEKEEEGVVCFVFKL